MQIIMNTKKHMKQHLQ